MRSYLDCELKNRPRVTGTFGLLYIRRHERLISELISDPAILSRFRDRKPLPPGLGPGMDERVVEYPWLFSRLERGALLDAGSTLNHEPVLDAALPRLGSLTIVTLAPEPRSFPDKGVSYVYADLADLPFRDSILDIVVSASTLEHAGMDSSLYAEDSVAAQDPDEHLGRALAEIRRVLKPGGRLLITVPYGQREDRGWMRQFDAEMVQSLVDELGASSSELTVFRYKSNGWKLSSLADASEARYYDIHSDEPAPEDAAVAARAVACLDLVLS